MSKTNINASASEAKATVVFGIDEHEKPRAARFTDAKPDLIGKAAQLMELKVCEASSPELAELAKKLPVGRLYANGRGFVPYVRRDLYAKLLAAFGHAPAADQPAPMRPLKVCRGPGTRLLSAIW